MANLRGADSSGANLEGADLTRAKLKDVNFEDAKMEAAKLGVLNKFHTTGLHSFESLFLYVLFVRLVLSFACLLKKASSYYKGRPIT